MERSQPFGHIAATMEAIGVRIQVYEGVDGATLQVILQAAKSCRTILTTTARCTSPADTQICVEALMG